MGTLERLDNPFAFRLTLTLLYFVWQGILLALLLALVSGALSAVLSASGGRWPTSRVTRLRYTLAVGALLLMAACVPLTFAWVSLDSPRPAFERPAPPTAAVARRDTAPELAQPPEHASGPGTEDELGSTGVSSASPARPHPVVDGLSGGHEQLRKVAPYVALAYFAGVWISLAHWLQVAWRVVRLSQSATRVDDTGLQRLVDLHARRRGWAVAPALRWCSEIAVPVVVGIIRPAILIPTSAATGLSVEQLQSLILHELAHIRRHDPWVHLVQRCLETLLFFHPAVWWVSRQVSRERERVCDDEVLSSGVERTRYADALVRMAELACAAPGRAAVAGQSLAADGAAPTEFKQRVLRVLGLPETPTPRPVWVALLLALVALLVTPSPSQWLRLPETHRVEASSVDQTYPTESSTARPARFLEEEGRAWAELLRVSAQDPGHIHATARHSAAPYTWKWSIHLPSGKSWRIYSQSGMLPSPQDLRPDDRTVSHAIVHNGDGRLIQLEAHLGPSAQDSGRLELWVEADAAIFDGVEHAVWIVDPEVASHIVGSTRSAGFSVEGGPEVGVVTTLNAGRAPFKLWLAGMRFGLPDSDGQATAIVRPGLSLWIAADDQPQAQDRPGASDDRPEQAAPHDKQEERMRPGGPAPSDPLEREVSLTADNEPLEKVVERLAQQAGLTAEFDRDALRQVGLDLGTPVTARIESLPLGRALSRVIDWRQHLGAMREVRGTRLVLTSLAATQARIHERLPEWLKPLYNRGLLASLDEHDQVTGVTVGDIMTNELLEQLTTLPELRELDFELTRALTPAGIAQLAKLPRLTKLSVNGRAGATLLGDDVIRAVAGRPTLLDLALVESGVTDDGVRHLERLPQLRSLSLRQEGRLTDAALLSIGKLHELESLSLDSYVGVEGLGWMRFSADAMRELRGLTKLRSLHVVGQALPPDALDFPHLTSLGLGHESIDDAVAVQIGKLRSLRSLELTYGSVGDDGLLAIAQLPELRRLDLSSLKVTDAGIGHLAGVAKLEHLSLRVEGLTDRALELVSGLPMLTRLDLYGSGRSGFVPGRNFSATGMSALTRLPALETLWLTNFQLGGGYTVLKELRRLRELTLTMCDISNAELDVLEEALPNTQIHHLTGGGGWRPRRPR